MTRLFISYRRTKAPRVDALVRALEAAGVEVWVDRDEIEDAASIQRRIDEGLAGCHALLAWYCGDYPKSRACQWELSAALIAASAETQPVKRILVINPESDNAHIQPLQVRDLQQFDAQDDDAALAERIAEAIRPIQGELGALRRLNRPSAYGFTPLGSSRFVGRVVSLWDIHSALAAGSFAIVAGRPSSGSASELVRVPGSGGIGKSLLVDEYALRFGAFWPGGLFWLRAYGNSDNPDESIEALAERRELAYSSQLVGFCQQLGIDTSEKTTAQLRAELGRDLTTPYLWIVDDLPDCGRGDLDPWLAPSSAGRTLITTRSRRLDGVGTALDLGLLDATDSRVLLTDGQPAPPDDDVAIKRILELLDGHALALDVARAACLRLRYAGFCKRLENPDADAMALAADIALDTPSGHSPYIAATLLGSIRQLEPLALDCLRIASLLAAAAIPSALVSNALTNADELDDDKAEEFAALGLQQLLNHSLAEVADATGAFTVHTLTARTLRFLDQSGSERRERLRAAAADALVKGMQDATDTHNHHQLRLILPHAQWLVEQKSCAPNFELVDWIGKFEFEAGRYRNAERWFRISYEGHFAQLGEQSPKTLTSMSSLATALRYQGSLAEAREIEERAVQICRHNQGELPAETLTAMTNLASTLREQGKYSDAHSLQTRVLAIRRLLLGEEHPDTLGIMNNLALTLGDQCDYSSAQELLEQVLAVNSRTFGELHRETLTSMNNLASTLRKRGDLAGARQLQERALAIRSSELGEDHPDTLTIMNNLAMTHGDQGNHEAAGKLQEQVQAAMRRSLGDEHPNSLMAMLSLAHTMEQQGDASGARMLQEKAYAMCRRALDAHHPTTLNAINNLALTLSKDGDHHGARVLQEEVLSACRRLFGQEHARTLSCMDHLAETLRSEGEHAGARVIQEQTLAIRRRVLRVDHPDTQTNETNLACTLWREGHLGAARDLRERVLANVRRTQGDEHPHTTINAWNLLNSVSELSDHVAARNLVERDLKWLLDRDLNSLSTDQKTVRDMLIEYLKDNENPEMSAVAPTETRTTEVDPRRHYVRTGITLEPGQRYTFTATGKWKDWKETCDHHGWHTGWMTHFARVKGVALFRLCGAIGKNDRNLFAIDTTQPWTVPETLPADGDHQLYLFANDGRWLYFNNHALSPEEGGPTRVTITRV